MNQPISNSELDYPTTAGDGFSHAESAEMLENLYRHAAVHDYTRCFLLTGPAKLGFFPREPFDDWTEYGADIKMVRIPHKQVHHSECPYLISLPLTRCLSSLALTEAVSTAAEDWQSGNLNQGKGHRIGAFLFSNAHIDMIADHLARVSLQPSPSGGQRLLSLADPAAFEGIWRVCNQQQQKRLLGPIGHWRIFDRWFNWRDCSLSEAGDYAELGSNVRSLLNLNAQQWMLLADVRAINRAWAIECGNGSYALREDFKRLPETMVRARNYGLSDPRDMELFARHALSIRADFDLHPLIQERLKRRPVDVYYSRMTSDLSASEWQEIRQGRQSPLLNQQAGS